MADRKNFAMADQQVVYCPTIFAKGTQIYIKIKCAACEQTIDLNLQSYWRQKKKDLSAPWICHQCKKPIMIANSKNNPLYKNDEYCNKFKKLHDDPVYHTKVHNKENNDKIATTIKKQWTDEAQRAKYMAFRLTPEAKAKMSVWAKKQWANKEYRDNQTAIRSSDEYKQRASKHSRKLWADPNYRASIIAALDKARPTSAPKGKISSLQRILYAILSDMKIDYREEGPETLIGPVVTTNRRFEGYSFDCLIFHNGRKIFVECNGDRWHKDNQRLGRDQGKSTFLNQYFPDYELLVIWEYEYRSTTRIKQIISEQLQLTEPPQVVFNFNDVKIAIEPVSAELQCFLATNHYLANIGRFGSFRIVARYNNKIIGAAIYSHPTRKESYERLKVKKNEIFELTRFCVHQQYHKPNFSSWLLGYSIRLIKQHHKLIKVLLSFADTSFQHTGTIYKASNWQLDGVVKPDYWYTDSKKWYHKKSVWDLASKNQVSEAEYAATYNLKKVMGREKLRFIYAIS